MRLGEYAGTIIVYTECTEVSVASFVSWTLTFLGKAVPFYRRVEREDYPLKYCYDPEGKNAQ